MDRGKVATNIYSYFKSKGVSIPESRRRAESIMQLDNEQQMTYGISAFSQFDSYIENLPENKKKVYKERYKEVMTLGKDKKALDMVRTVGNIAKHLKGRLPNPVELTLARGVLMFGGLDFPFDPIQSGKYTEALGGEQ